MRETVVTSETNNVGDLSPPEQNDYSFEHINNCLSGQTNFPSHVWTCRVAAPCVISYTDAYGRVQDCDKEPTWGNDFDCRDYLNKPLM